MTFAADLRKPASHTDLYVDAGLHKLAANVITTKRVVTIDLHVTKLQDGRQISSVCDIQI